MHFEAPETLVRKSMCSIKGGAWMRKLREEDEKISNIRLKTALLLSTCNTSRSVIAVHFWSLQYLSSCLYTLVPRQINTLCHLWTLCKSNLVFSPLGQNSRMNVCLLWMCILHAIVCVSDWASTYGHIAVALRPVKHRSRPCHCVEVGIRVGATENRNKTRRLEGLLDRLRPAREKGLWRKVTALPTRPSEG